MSQQKQLPYKPKKERVKPLPKQPKKPEADLDQVLDYFYSLIWKHRGFILLTLLLLTWTYVLVEST